MEIFAFTQNAVGYEDSGAEPQLRSFDEFNIEIPKSAILGAAGVAAATVVMGHSPEAHAIVDSGDRCAAVSTIQQTLNSRGFNAGNVDGVYGHITEGAVERAQRFYGLNDDGVVGPNTASALGLDPNISCGVSQNPGGGGGLYRVTTPSGINVRSNPDTSAARQYGVSSPSTIGLTDTRVNSDGYEWAQVSDGNWVAVRRIGGATYLARINGNIPENPGGGGGLYRVTTPSGVNVRSNPDTSAARRYGRSQTDTIGLTDTRVTSDGFVWAEVSDGNWVALRPVGGSSYMVKIN